MGMGMAFQMCKFREWEWEGPSGNWRDWEYWKPFPHISSTRGDRRRHWSAQSLH